MPSSDSTQNALPLATKALWTHLLRKPTTSERDTSTPPLPSNIPLTPTDRAATSTRILLHDTHARLETFTERLEKLVHSVEEGKREMTRAREDMEAERDKMTEDIVHLVNRCQTSVQKSVGEPAQASAISSLWSEISNTKEKLANVESKLDTLQMQSQGHSQALQTIIDQQSRAQDQHMKMMEHLAPLLPLLQAIPLHIDVSKTAVVEKIRETADSVHQAIAAIPTRELQAVAEPRRQRTVSDENALVQARMSSKPSQAYPPFPTTPIRHPLKRRRLNSPQRPPANVSGSEHIVLPRIPQSSIGQDGPQSQHVPSQECSIPPAQPRPPLSLEGIPPNSRAESMHVAPERDIVSRSSIQRAQTAYLLGYSASSHSTHTPSGSRSGIQTSSTSVTVPPSAGDTSHVVYSNASAHPLPSMPPSSDLSRSAAQSAVVPSLSESTTRQAENVDNITGNLVSSGPSLIQPSSLPSPSSSGTHKPGGAPSLRARRMYGEIVTLGVGRKRFIPLDDEEEDF